MNPASSAESRRCCRESRLGFSPQLFCIAESRRGYAESRGRLSESRRGFSPQPSLYRRESAWILWEANLLSGESALLLRESKPTLWLTFLILQVANCLSEIPFSHSERQITSLGSKLPLVLAIFLFERQFKGRVKGWRETYKWAGRD